MQPARQQASGCCARYTSEQLAYTLKDCLLFLGLVRGARQGGAPEWCWNWVRERIECRAWPNSWNSVCAWSGLSAPAEDIAKLHR